MYSCPSCGAGLFFNPKKQLLECKYCTNTYTIQEIENKKENIAKAEENKIETNKEKYNAISYKCSQCGAELITTTETIAAFCNYCGSSVMVEEKNVQKVKPDYVIPFSKTKEECLNEYKKKIRKAFFAPKNMKEEQQLEKIRGIYMPYWIYTYEKHGELIEKGQKYSKRIGDYEYYDDYELKTYIDVESSGIIHDATSNFYDDLSGKIAPYKINQKKKFSPTYLSGYYADSEDVESEVYIEESCKIANEQATKEMNKIRKFVEYGIYNKNINLEHKKTELGLFPVYFLSTKNKKGDRISYSVINGQTGKIAADIPIDSKKYILFSLLLAIPIFLLLNMFATITPTIVLLISIIFGIINLTITNIQSKELYIKEQKLNDKGFLNKEKDPQKKYKKIETKKINFSKVPIEFVVAVFCIQAVFIYYAKFAHENDIEKVIRTLAFLGIISYSITKFIKDLILNKKDENLKEIKKEQMHWTGLPLFGLIVPLIIYFINPVYDMFYYGAAIFSIIVELISLSGIIKQYNIITTRKLPQLEKRGGDQ